MSAIVTIGLLGTHSDVRAPVPDCREVDKRDCDDLPGPDAIPCQGNEPTNGFHALYLVAVLCRRDQEARPGSTRVEGPVGDLDLATRSLCRLDSTDFQVSGHWGLLVLF